MEEKDMVMNGTAEETVSQPVWEVVPDPVDMDELEEKLEDVEEKLEEAWDDAEQELKRGIAAVKDWLHNTLYEAGRIVKEHKIAVLAIVGAVATVITVAGVIWALLKRED